jgi:hypothetical protein
VRRMAETVAFVVSLILIQSLAIVQSARYLEDFVTWSTSPALMHGVALATGAALGWAAGAVWRALVAPLALMGGAALVFFIVAWSPVWLGESRYDIAVVNELLRQATLVFILGLIPAYVGAIAGFFARELREQ